MINLLEKHYIAWLITLFIAVIIFYMSSRTFEGVPLAGVSINSYLYHLVIFFLFSFFLSMSVVKGRQKERILAVILISIVYGIFDEFHQLFVQGRSSDIRDVLLDSVGSLISISFYFIIISLRKPYKNLKTGLKVLKDGRR